MNRKHQEREKQCERDPEVSGQDEIPKSRDKMRMIRKYRDKMRMRMKK
jgi:hypothetical protein